MFAVYFLQHACAFNDSPVPWIIIERSSSNAWMKTKIVILFELLNIHLFSSICMTDVCLIVTHITGTRSVVSCRWLLKYLVCVLDVVKCSFHTSWLFLYETLAHEYLHFFKDLFNLLKLESSVCVDAPVLQHCVGIYTFFLVLWDRGLHVVLVSK